MLAESIRPEPGSKAGDVLGTILRFLPKRRDWSVRDIKENVSAHGVKATDKQVFNAVGHLARRGYVTRVGYGQYIVQGAMLTTLDELGVEPSRVEQMDPN
jgi:predicted transcriptional regulator of viral defense system